MTGDPYYSFLAQTFHYFSRPHEGVPGGPVSSLADWRGEQLARRDDWRRAFAGDEIAEIDDAIGAAEASGKPLREMTRDDFRLPRLSRAIAAWRGEIDNGVGFKVLSGLPVERWGEARSSLFFWCLGLHLGRPGAQNRNGDLLGHVRDTGADKADPFVRQYLTTQSIPYHCDAADVVGLLCLTKAKSGGRSRIASSIAIYNEIRRRRPDLAPRLFAPFMLDTRDESGVTGAGVLPVPPCQFGGGVLRTFYHAEYFRTSQRHPGVSLTKDESDLLDLYDEIADSPVFRLDMDLEPGDIQLLSNHSIVHARTDYEDHPEPARKRHLLRLWLSIEKRP